MEARGGVVGRTPSILQGMRVGAGSTQIALDLEAGAKESFARFRGIALDGALDPLFLATLQSVCRDGIFVSDPSEPGHREAESPQRAGIALNLALSRATLLRWLEEVTGCGPISQIAGRVVQTLPRAGDELRWHDDLVGDGRLLAITINLSEARFVGGAFQLRSKSGEMRLEHQHSEAGSMLIFRVSPRLEHRVLPLTSGGPRRVYAGWAFAGA